MTRFELLPLTVTILLMGWSGPAATAAQEVSASSYAATGPVREPRGFKKKVCKKYGICEGYGGFQGGHGGFQGGYGGHQGGYGGYQGQLPPINIGISQSQSSASAGGGGYSNGYYPNNYQYNGYGGYPGQGGYGGYGGYGGNQGYRPGFGNGNGAYNNQFNGNYYGPASGGYPGGGYGFQGPRPFFDENPDEEGNDPSSDREHHEHSDYGNRQQGYSEDYSAAGSFAFSGRKNQ